jgi:predicted O-methyltransferase YrrM
MSVPPLVLRAKVAARALGIEASCRDDDGLLLHVLAARRGVERVAEIGTGAGVGAAWIASALAPGAVLSTAELSPERSAAARMLFSDDPDVHVLEGDWRSVLPPQAPFDLIFVDAGDAKDDPDTVVGLASPGATIVLDDFTGSRPGPDARRAGWLRHRRLAAVEVGTGGEARVIVATVRR